jgi:hypothetical protein
VEGNNEKTEVKKTGWYPGKYLAQSAGAMSFKKSDGMNLFCPNAKCNSLDHLFPR